MEIGSYQTAWVMLHRLRSVLARPGRERLTGTVEMDKTFIGGEEPGLAGGRARGKKSLVGVAVELREPKGFGRCRMGLLSDASAPALLSFLADHVAPGATLITDGWAGYQGITELGYHHDRRSQRAARTRGEDAAKLLPGMHRVAPLAKRWLIGIHQGSVDEAHLGSYLNEFVFRFNRRRSRSRGLVFYRLLELATATGISSSIPGPPPARPCRRSGGDTRRAWIVHQPDVPGERSDFPRPVKWIPRREISVGRPAEKELSGCRSCGRGGNRAEKPVQAASSTRRSSACIRLVLQAGVVPVGQQGG